MAVLTTRSTFNGTKKQHSNDGQRRIMLYVLTNTNILIEDMQVLYCYCDWRKRGVLDPISGKYANKSLLSSEHFNPNYFDKLYKTKKKCKHLTNMLISKHLTNMLI